MKDCLDVCWSLDFPDNWNFLHHRIPNAVVYLDSMLVMTTALRLATDLMVWISKKNSTLVFHQTTHCQFGIKDDAIIAPTSNFVRRVVDLRELSMQPSIWNTYKTCLPYAFAQRAGPLSPVDTG